MINPNKPDYSNTPASPARAGTPYRLADSSAAPVVSIVTPFYNAGAVFFETVESVFRQTLQQWEWIIVNDGSTDAGAVKILNDFRQKDPRIRVVDHPQNKGLSAARNTGFREARTDYIYQLDADDLIEPTTLEKLVWHLHTFPEFGFANGLTVGFGSKEYLWGRGFHSGARFLEENMVTATCMVRKSVHQAVGGYESENRGGLEDWDFWLKCASRGHWGSTIREFFDWYRRRDINREHWDNLTQTDKMEKFRAKLKQRYAGLWEKFPQINIARPPLSSSVAAEIPFANRLVKKNPRLLLIVPHYELGGADKFNLDLIRQLQANHGYEITVASTRPSRNPWQHEFEGLTRDIFALGAFLNPGDFPLFLRYLIESRQPDAVCLSNSLFGYQILPYLRAHFPELPFVDYLHMEEEDWMGGGYPRHSLHQRSQIARTGVTSQHLKNWMTNRGAEADGIEVCPCNIDADKFNRARFDVSALATKWNIDKSKPVILYAGRVCEQKQPKVFAEVIRQAAKKNPNFTALVAGDGPDLPWLKEFVEREKLTQVRFLGAVANDAIAELLAVTDIFFLPSQWEGIALTIYEAMAMSVVPLGAVVGGQPELVTPDCGVLVQRGPNEVTDYTKALLKLLASPADRARMAQAARQRIEEKFQITELGHRMKAIFEGAKAAAQIASRENVLPLNMAVLYGSAVVEQARAASYADQMHHERSELISVMAHSTLWQGCLRGGRALADAGQSDLAVKLFEEGLRLAATSKVPSVEFGACLEIGKAVAPLNLDRAKAALARAGELVDQTGDPAGRNQIALVRAKLDAIRPAKPAQKTPVVSVVIPCHKQAHFLAEAVESVVTQTFPDLEIIIVNDGSPDNTSEVANQLIAKYPGKSIRLVEKANGGLPAARNSGFKAARGKYLLPLDADDKIKPELLAELVPILDSRPKVGFAYPHIQHFGDVNSEFPLPDFDGPTFISKDNIGCVCSLIRRTAWEQIGGYNETMREGYEDWDFWIGCIEHGWEGHCLHEPLFLYRKSGTSMLSDANQKRERLIAQIVLNHPKLYNEATRKSAQELIARHAASKAVVTAAPVTNGRRLRLTYLISSILGVTGGNQTLLRQAGEMRRRGHEVNIVTYTPKPDWFQFETRVIQVPAGQPMAGSVPPSDIVIATYFSNAHELCSVKAPVKIYYAQGDQFIFDDATMADTPENRQWRRLSRASYELPGIRFVPNSRNLANAVQKLCGRAPDAILPVCTDQTIFRPLQKSVPGSKFRLLIVGPDARGSESEPLLFKGIQDIHDALQILARKYPHFTAVRMSGTAPEIFARFPCEFYIAPSDEMKTVLYGTSHIHIYASHYDSCPRPPQEAMAAGCAVVCTATPGAMEYCRDGENSLLVPIKSPETIAAAIERLIHDHPLREKLVRGGLATGREFPREREWNEWESILFRFMDEAAKPATPKPVKAPKAIRVPACGLMGQLTEAGELLKKKNFQAAWDSACAVIKARPFHPEAYLFLGKVAQAAGDFDCARQCGVEATKLAPDWKPASQFLKAIPRGSGKAASFALPAMEKMPRLSVCLIAKNEEQFLEQCLKSVRDIASQIVVVDTGSTDRTVEIAKKFNAEVHTFAWNDDFSAARNEALRHATGDWVLSLDADEEVSPEHLKTIREEMQTAKTLGFRIPIIDKGCEDEGRNFVPRLFRNAPGLFFVGRIHEQIFSSLEVRAKEWNLENRLGRTVLVHHGYSKEVVAARGKTARNLRLLQLAVEESPGEPNLLMNLGLELIRSNQLDAGLHQYREALRLLAATPAAQIVPELREALLTQLTTHLLGAKRFSEIVELWRQPFPKSSGLTASQHFMLGVAQLELKQPAEAAEHMRQCLAKRGQPVLSPVNKDILKAGPRHCLARALAELEQPAEAERAYREALAEDATSRLVRFDYAVFNFMQGRGVEALTLANELVAADRKDLQAWLFGGQVAMSQPDYLEFAQDWTSEAVKEFPGEMSILAQRAEALMLNQRLDLALPLWSQVETLKSARYIAALTLCQALGAGCFRNFAPPIEKIVSQEFLKWYRQMIKFKANTVVNQINEKLPEIGTVLPSAVEVLGAAMKQAEMAMAV